MPALTLEAVQPLALLAPAATFVLVMNARQAHLSDLLRRNASAIDALCEEPVERPDRLQCLVDQNTALTLRYRQIMVALQCYLAGMVLLGLLAVVAPVADGAFGPLGTWAAHLDRFWALALPAVPIGCGVALTAREMAHAFATLRLETDYVRARAAARGIHAADDAGSFKRALHWAHRHRL